MKKRLPRLPPTIGHLRDQGHRAALICCLGPDCYRPPVRVDFEVIGLSDATPFPEIARRRRFRCQGCGSNRVDASPDWSDYVAQGNGKQRLWCLGNAPLR
jgi:hypothetical protein